MEVAAVMEAATELAAVVVEAMETTVEVEAMETMVAEAAATVVVQLVDMEAMVIITAVEAMQVAVVALWVYLLLLDRTRVHHLLHRHRRLLANAQLAILVSSVRIATHAHHVLA